MQIAIHDLYSIYLYDLTRRTFFFKMKEKLYVRKITSIDVVQTIHRPELASDGVRSCHFYFCGGGIYNIYI